MEIRNIESGEWLHNNGRQPAPAPVRQVPVPQAPVTFFRVPATKPAGDYRRERIVHIPSITQIEVRGTSIKVYVANDPEPLRLFEHEYALLIEHLEYSGAMLDLGTELPG